MNLSQEKRHILNGILGTVAFHMVVAIAFLGIQIGNVKKAKQAEILEIEFINELINLEKFLEEKSIEPAEIEPLDYQTAKNIAVNVAANFGKEISTEEYINELKDELGIDDLNPKYDNTLPDEINVIEENDKKDEESKPENYKGKTNITYSLKDRWKRKIPVPVYKCEGGGLVVINIIVNQSGYVVEANVSRSETKASELCLVEEALASAKRSRFNTDFSAQQRQKGSISYNFIPQ